MASFNPIDGLTDPQNIAIRPLNVGVRLDVPSSQVPAGGLIVAGNLIVDPSGLRKRPMLVDHRSDAVITEPDGTTAVIQDISLMWTTGGSQKVVVLTEKYPYLLQLSGYTRLVSSYATGFTKRSGALLLGSGTAFLATATNIAVGDACWRSSAVFLGYIKSITTDTKLVLDRVPTATASTFLATRIDRCLYDARPAYHVDTEVADNKLLIADTAHKIMAYDGSTYAVFDTDIGYRPSALCYFSDRLYAANLIEGAVDARQRLRWSTVTDKTDLDALQYLDLPYAPGFIRRILALGSVMMLYMSDSVWVGRGTSISGDELPTVFERFNTSGNGLVGTRAVCSFLDGHFLLMSDGPYYISGSLEAQRIGQEVQKEMLADRGGLEKAIVRPDPENDCILFAIPSASTKEFTRIWRFNYKSKAWSSDLLGGTALARLGYESILSWTDINETTSGTTDTWADMAYFKSWATMKSGGRIATWAGDGGKVYFFERTGLSSIPVVLESGDIDFDAPDVIKTVLRMSVRISGQRSTVLAFSVRVSADRGHSWKNAGLLSIPADSDEDSINFRASGSSVRFRLESSSNIEEYMIEEIVLRVAGRGGEVHLAANR